MKKNYISPSVKVKAINVESELLNNSVTGVSGFDKDDNPPAIGGDNDGTHPVGAKEGGIWEE